MGSRGRQAVRQRYHWGIDEQRLIETIEAAARGETARVAGVGIEERGAISR
jgi:hypothetical protein